MAEGNEEDRSQIIAHFQELSGIEDHDKSVEILSLHQWNLEASIQDTLNEKEGRSPIYTPPSPTQSPLPPLLDQPAGAGAGPRRRIQVPVTRYAQPIDGPVVRHHQQQQQGWWDWLMNLALFPLRFTVTSASDLFQLLMSLVFGLRPTPARDSTADVQQFVSEFEAEYGTQHPRYLTCGYDQALTKARDDLQFLLVYIHSPLHRDTSRFCREVLCSQEFVDFARDRLLMWGVGLNTQEGARVSYILRESSYPFLALVVLKQSRLMVCERMEGILSAEALMQRLQTAITSNEAELVVERNERHRRMFDQQLRVDQDAAYQESLSADREKERLKQQVLEREATFVRQAEEKLQEEKKQKEEFEIDRAMRVSRIPAEPDSNHPSSITVLLRLPSGHRLERRFSETDKLESVYDFAYTVESDQPPPRFTLVMNFPRKELRPDNTGGPQLRDLELGKRCALYAEEN